MLKDKYIYIHHNCDYIVTIVNICNNDVCQSGRVAMPPVATRRYVSSILTSDFKDAEKEVEWKDDTGY